MFISKYQFSKGRYTIVLSLKEFNKYRVQCRRCGRTYDIKKEDILKEKHDICEICYS